MTTFKLNFPAVAIILLLVGSSELSAQQSNANAGEQASSAAPQGSIAPLFRVTGARASSTLTTAIHCSNNDAVPVTVYVSYFDYDNTYVCGISSAEMPAGATNTFTTADTAVFNEDHICPGPPPVLGQGRVEIGTFPFNAKVICSAQVVSLTGSTPATLSSLDVFPAN